jgi:hypothetical protein
MLSAAVALGSPAWAHFVWIELQGGPATRQAKVYFSETAEPGAARLLDRLAPTSAWACGEGEEPRRLELRPWTDPQHDEGALVADLPGYEGALAAECCYGVFERGELAILLKYYARYLPPGNEQGVGGEKLPLDIQLRGDAADPFLTVSWRGEPLAGAEVSIRGPDGEEHELKSDARGEVAFPEKHAGKYAIRAKHVEKDQGGEHGGKRYEQTWHFATLIVHLSEHATTSKEAERVTEPVKQVTIKKLIDGDSSEDASAAEALSAARKHRAVWDDFPGFRATAEVWLDGEKRQAEVIVSPKGDVDLKGLDGLGRGFVDRHLSSLVMHRMPGSQFEEEAGFEADDHHVLGRRLRLAEERMGSVYRIRDNVISEVNRSMGRQRFTISVIDVSYNDEGKYLPHVFTVSFWDEKTGDLEATESVYHQWERVGRYDLPKKLMVVSTGDQGKRQVLQIEFEDLELLSDAK